MRTLKPWEWIVLISCIILLAGGLLYATWYAITAFVIKQTPDSLPSTPNVVDDWQKIQTLGKIVVGVSADYPPFEYYDTNFNIDGFDPALMIEIGKKLGISVEFNDFAFEGLGSALYLGQIDAAISAISYTPERDALVDFSNVYYVGLDAILSRQGANIGPITSIDQFSPYRVGVQSNTVYQSFIQEQLIDQGKMSSENLLVYTRIDTAIQDLKENKIDLVYLDLEPAKSFIQSGGMEIVGSNLNQQLYVIAVRNGSTRLINEINGALTELNNEGKINQLARVYLNLGEGETLPPIPPTPTPGPNPTPTPVPPQPPACLDGMSYVKDLNLDDNNMQNPPKLIPGQPFTKGWQIKNTGTCTWNSSYYLAFAYGNNPAARMGGQPTPIRGTVPPGATYDIYVNFVSPLEPGIYKSTWNLVNPLQQAFGERIWVGIEVVPNPTPTPPATQTPSPNMQFSANPTTITSGQAVVFTWNVSGAKQVFFYIQGQNFNNFPVASQGTKTEYPSQSITYELRSVYLNDSVEVRQIFIQVNPPPVDAPKIIVFTLAPPDWMYEGQCAAIQWSISGNVTKVRLLRNNGEIWGNAPVNGTYNDCPPGIGTMVYAIEATGPGGIALQQDALDVYQQPSTPVPTNTPAPLLPSIEYFNVNPNQVLVGGCVKIDWKVGGGANRALLLRNDAVVLDNAPLAGNAQDCLQKAGQVIYKIIAYNPQGQTTEAQSMVTVTQPPQNQNPLPGTSWKLAFYFDGVGAMVSPILNSEIFLRFSDDANFTGNTGCNDYAGKYQVFDNNININPDIQMTAKSCGDQGMMDQEQRYLQLFRTAVKFEILANKLVLYDGAGQRILEYDIFVQPR